MRIDDLDVGQVIRAIGDLPKTMADLESENNDLRKRVRNLEGKLRAADRRAQALMLDSGTSIDDYQDAAMETARFGPVGHDAVRPMVQCFIEMGKIAERAKKVFRDKKGVFGEWDCEEIGESFQSIEFWGGIARYETRYGELQDGGNSIVYPLLGLVGETGEVAGKLFKLIKENPEELTAEDREGVIKEVGDVLWYIAAIANILDVPLSRVASENIAKCRDRRERNQIHGEGDNR